MRNQGALKLTKAHSKDILEITMHIRFDKVWAFQDFYCADWIMFNYIPLNSDKEITILQ